MKLKSDPYAELIRQTRRLNQASRKDLALAVNNARSTVGRQVDQLVQSNYLIELGPEAVSSAGRPRILLELNPNAGCFFGIDFEARSLFGIVVDFAQNTIARHTITHQQAPSADSLLHSIKLMTQHLQHEAGGLTPLAIGLGVPGHVDPEKGLALHYEHISGWQNIKLTEEVGSYLNIPVFLENNTRTMILAERWFGSGANCDDLVCINVRTGLSCAAISGGKLLHGANNLAGEIRGWPAPRICDSGEEKSIEQAGSLTAILDPYAGEGNDLTSSWNRFRDQLKFQDPEALKKLTDIACIHGATAATLAQFLDPEKIIITGPLTQIGDNYLDLIKVAFDASMKGLPSNEPSILLSKLGLHSGALGAAALALQQWIPVVDPATASE